MHPRQRRYEAWLTLDQIWKFTTIHIFLCRFTWYICNSYAINQGESSQQERERESEKEKAKKRDRKRSLGPQGRATAELFGGEMPLLVDVTLKESKTYGLELLECQTPGAKYHGKQIQDSIKK